MQIKALKTMSAFCMCFCSIIEYTVPRGTAYFVNSIIASFFMFW